MRGKRQCAWGGWSAALIKCVNLRGKKIAVELDLFSSLN